MSCNCNKAINTGACIANFTVGTAEPNTGYNVYFQIPSGRIDVYPVTSDTDGKVVVETPRIRIGDTYQVWLNQPGDSMAKQINFNIGDTEVSCISMKFTACFDEDEYMAPVDGVIQLQEE